YKEGVVTNRRKTLYRDKMVATFSFGSKETYDFLDDNPGVLHIRTEEANDPDVIAKNYKMVSVNTTLQIDLAGQCASEAVGTMQISGIGGQSETAVGAKASPGGKSIIALRSTAMVKNQAGKRERRSTIVAAHPAGTMISLLRSDTDYVVIEYGVAPLRGASLAERVKLLSGIAHPDFREELRSEAKKYHLI
nr:4-hydroxybutyrate--acetyl-CoA CoA transferase [Clostridia bacterium]